MSFDGTISLGSLIQIVMLLALIVAAFVALRGQVRLLEEKITNEAAQRAAFTSAQREQLHALTQRLDRVEVQVGTEIEKIGVKLDEGLRRIYDKLDRKADKP